MRRLLLPVALFLVLAPAAHAGGPGMLIGAAEDAVRAPTVTAAKAKLMQLRLAGFTAVRVTETWTPGKTSPDAGELGVLRNVVGAARLLGMQSYVAVYNVGSKTTPLSDTDRRDFAAFAASVVSSLPNLDNIVVGNEPNINRFWLPQFNADGSNAAATAYTALLAQTYDAVKAARPSVTVIGGALSPRGGDRPGTGRDTHSPTTFIVDMGTAYRASGRTLPLMDQFAIHPYLDNSSQPPTFTHPNTTTISIADYTKLVALLGQAFDGTAQPGSTLPIVYGEFGIETQIPESKASAYTSSEFATTKPVAENVQGDYYRQAIGLAFCQPNVRTFLFFHAFDEPSLQGWQSGVFYADGTPKASLDPVAQATRDSRGGVIAKCLQLTPQGQVVYPRGTALRKAPLKISVTCDVDCTIYARVERLPKGSTTFAAYGKALAGVKTPLAFPTRQLAPGSYRFTVRLTAPVNTGPRSVLTSDSFTLG